MDNLYYTAERRRLGRHAAQGMRRTRAGRQLALYGGKTARHSPVGRLLPLARGPAAAGYDQGVLSREGVRDGPRVCVCVCVCARARVSHS